MQHRHRQPPPSLALGLAVGALISAAIACWVPDVRVVDGDTIDHGYWRWRIVGIDTPEIRGAHCAEESALGRLAAERLRTLTRGQEILVRPHHGKDKFGRRLASLWRGGVNLGDVLVDEGLAHRYSGRTPRLAWCQNAKRPPPAAPGAENRRRGHTRAMQGAGKAEITAAAGHGRSAMDGRLDRHDDRQ